MALLPLAPFSASAEILFSDDFQNDRVGAPPSRWTPPGKGLACTVKQEGANKVLSMICELYGDQNYYGEIAPKHLSAKQWSNYQWQLRFKVRPLSTVKQEAPSAYLLFYRFGVGAPTATMRFMPTRAAGSLGYHGRLPEEVAALPLAQRAIQVSYKQAGYPFLDRKAELLEDTWYQVRIVADSDKKEVAIFMKDADRNMQEVKLLQTPVFFTEGGVGLAVWRGEVLYDDIRVETLR